MSRKRRKPDLVNVDEAAEILGVQPQSVRSTLRRYGVVEHRGYLRSEVESLQRVGRGRRTDLHDKDTRT